MENREQTHHSTPLVTRLDDLEVILNNLQGKHNLTQWGKNNKVQGVETLDLKLNLAVKEAHMNSSLMNGVTSLENRQSQLSLEHDSSTKIKNGDAASSQESKRGFFRSLPIFNSLYQSHKKDLQLLDKKDRQLPADGSGIQGKPSKVQQRRKQLTNSLTQNGENKPSKEEKAYKNGENKPIKDEKACKNNENKPSKDEKAWKNEENKPIKDENTCKNGENKPSKDEKAFKKEKKRIPRNWLPQLLGC